MPMTRILLVKMSSMGDVVHNLPLVTDIHRRVPGAQIDWAVEEGFDAIPRLHPGVRRIIPVAIRRWRRTFWRRPAREEVRAFLDELGREAYDAVLDTQGLLKSALIARVARGNRFGLDWESAREPLALFYDRTFNVPRTLHAVERNRRLGAQAFGYTLPDGIDYGIRAAAGDRTWLPAQRYAVLLHATSAERKLWPEECWLELGGYFAERGMRCVLPWGTAAERARSERIAGRLRDAIVPPLLRLGEAAGLLAGAPAVIGVDTGLTHLAAALGVATIGVYCATDPARTGLYGCVRAANLGGVYRPPRASEVVAALERMAA